MDVARKIAAEQPCCQLGVFPGGIGGRYYRREHGESLCYNCAATRVSLDVINTDLSQSAGTLGPGLDLTSMNHAATQFSLAGRAESEQDVIQYARDLKDTGLFSEITIQSINLGVSDNGTETYAYSLDLKLGEKK